MILAKWGGSLLTNKSTRGPSPVFKAATARRLAEEWATGVGDRPGVLVHGAGRFGHPQALAHGIGRRRLSGDALRRAVLEVRAAVLDLQGRVVDALRDAGLPAVAVPAPTAAHARRGGLELHPGPFLELLDHGFLPVTGGDVVFDARLGLRVLSGDEILERLAPALDATRVVFATDVDGLVVDGRLILELPRAASRGVLRKVDAGSDATGGMHGKLAAAIAIQTSGIEARIVNGSVPRRFADALRGRGVGTTLPAGPKGRI